MSLRKFLTDCDWEPDPRIRNSEFTQESTSKNLCLYEPEFPEAQRVACPCRIRDPAPR
jgi:hypothetical protein